MAHYKRIISAEGQLGSFESHEFQADSRPGAKKICRTIWERTAKRHHGKRIVLTLFAKTWDQKLIPLATLAGTGGSNKPQWETLPDE